MPKRTPISKITRPHLPGIYARTRLFRVLDKQRNIPVTWVSGPAGSGKTTLVASWLDTKKLPCLWYQVDEGDSDIASFFYYLGIATQKVAPRYRKPLPLLTPEYLLGIPIFTRNFFGELYSRLKSPFVIVFDNYQEASEQSQLHDVVNRGLSLLPAGIQAFILSRNEPPSTFARFRANGSIMHVGWDELRFALEETKQIMGRKYRGNLTDDAVSLLQKKTQGWAAGLVLLMEGAGSKAKRPSAGYQLDANECFDYFAEEVFDKMDGETRNFLLRTSLLPTMTERTTEKMTGKDDAGRTLSVLNRNSFFTEKYPTEPPTYAYHPLFREFLLAKLKQSLKTEDRDLLQCRAATVLEEAGQIEAAVVLYLQASDWESAVRMILGHAQTLLLQGRSKTLEEWMNRIPREIIEVTPWLLYWSGMCYLGYDPARARLKLDKAFDRFNKTNDHLGMVLSWSFFVIAVHYEWNDFYALDKWISIYFEQIERILPGMPPFIRVRAFSALGIMLVIRRPDHPQIGDTIESVLSLAEQTNDMESRSFALMIAAVYFLWTGNFFRCRAVLDKMAPASLSEASRSNHPLAIVIYAGRILVDVSNLEKADKIIFEALAVSANTGILVWDQTLFLYGIYSSLMRGDMAEAEKYLEKMGSALIPSRKEMYAQYHLANCWYQFLRGNYSRALTHAETGLKLDEETGYGFARIIQLHALAQVLHALKDGKADEYLERALDLAVKSRSAGFEFQCRLARALFALDAGKEKAGVELLREALALGKKYGYFQLLYWWDPRAMSRLAVKALENGIEPDYVRELIRLTKLVPEEPPMHIEDWPWPLRVRTLGRFRVMKDDKPLSFSGRAQAKPLEMLKALIAFGGNEVREERVVDALWPDAEGNVGHASFKTTLHRLRQMLGREDALQVQDGRVTLDPQCFWIDAWTFEKLSQDAERELVNFPQAGPAPSGMRRDKLNENSRIRNVKSSYKSAADLLDRSLSLYQGHFLRDEGTKPWAVSMQERLKEKFLRAVEHRGKLWEMNEDYEKAAACYRKGLEVDDLAEKFYQRLIACHLKRGSMSEAARAYERCRKVLSAHLCVEPSEETEKIYRRSRG